MSRRAATAGAVALLAGAAAGAGVPAARATPASYGPAVSAVGFSGGSELHVLWNGGGGGVLAATQVGVPGGAWQGPGVVPGSPNTIAAGPAQVVAGNDGEIVSAWQGPDGGIWYSVYTRAGWTAGPSEIPGTAGTAVSAPALDSAQGGNQVAVYWHADGGAIDETYASLPLSSWHAPFAIPGSAPASGTPGVLSAPTATVSHGGSEQDIFWQGADGALYQTAYVTGSGWTVKGAEIPDTGGRMTSAPAAVGVGASSVNVYWRNTHADVDEASYYSGAWHDTHQIPGPANLTSAPSATLSANGVDNDVVWESAGRIVRTYWTSAAGWLSAPLADVPMTAAAPTPGPAPPVTTLHRSGSAPISIVPRHRRRGAVHVKVVASWRWYPRTTRLRSLTFVGLPRRASVTLTCAGTRCPQTRWSARPGHVRSFRRHVANRLFPHGDALTLTIAVRHQRSEQIRMRIRAGRRPLVKLLSR